MLRMFIFIIACIIIGCSSIEPQFVKKNNSYNYRDLSLNKQESIIFIHTYAIESLENSYEKIFCTSLNDCYGNISNVKNDANFKGFDLSKKPILNNELNIKSVDLYRVTYHTKGQNGEDELVSGGIYYPNITKPRGKIKGVILFFHPTFFAKNSVSSYDINNPINKSVAALFAANGYVVLYPDYVGMGINHEQVHPYVLYPQVNAIDGLSIIQASQNFIKNKLQLASDIPLYVTGYSEGSAYVLWFSRLYQEQTDFKSKLDNSGYKLKKVIPIDGAYNLSEVTWKYLFSNNNTFNSDVYRTSNSLITGGLKPPLITIALVSYGFYAESANYINIFNPEFFNMYCSLQFASNCNINNESNINLSQLLKLESSTVINLPQGDNAFEIYIVNKINNSANHKINNNGIYTLFTNNIKPLVNNDLQQNQKLITLLYQGDVYYWHSEIPTVLLTLRRDSVVSPLNSEYAYIGMLADGSKNLQYIIVDNDLIENKFSKFIPSTEVDHLNGFAYLFIVALKQFDN
jgi:hypothetical protein